MGFDVKAAKKRLEVQAQEQERRKMEAALSGSLGILTVKDPGKAYMVQFYKKFNQGVEIPWHKHVKDYKLDGPCRIALGEKNCFRCKDTENYRPATKPGEQKTDPRATNPQYFFAVYVFPDPHGADPNEKYPQVGNRVLPVKQSSNHPWDVMIDDYTDGVDLREGKYIYKCSLDAAAKKKFTLRYKSAAEELPEGMECPTDEQIIRAIIRLYDKDLYQIIKEREETTDDEEDEAPKRAPRKSVPKPDAEEEEEMFAVSRKASRRDEEDVEPKVPATIVRPKPIARQQDEEDEEKPKAKRRAVVEDEDEEPAPKKSKMPVQDLKKKPVEPDEEDDEDLDAFRLSVS